MVAKKGAKAKAPAKAKAAVAKVKASPAKPKAAVAKAPPAKAPPAKKAATTAPAKAKAGPGKKKGGKGKKAEPEADVEEVEKLDEAEEDEEASDSKQKTKSTRLEDALREVAEEAEEDEGEEEEEGEDDDEEAEPTGKKAGKKAKSSEPRGVIYIGHLPRGFFEPQLRKFFVQFGKVTRLRLSRSKKNAQSKGYAFVEFEDEEVARIVSNTMTKYLMFGKQLVCHIVPPAKVHPALFKGCRKRMVNFGPRRRRQAKEAYNNRPKVEVDGESLPQTTTRQESRRKKSDKKLSALLVSLGVDYDPSMAAAPGAQAADESAKGTKRKAAEAAPPKSPKGGPGKAKAKAKGRGKA